jgi:predicted nuclease with TOPRIM domain
MNILYFLNNFLDRILNSLDTHLSIAIVFCYITYKITTLFFVAKISAMEERLILTKQYLDNSNSENEKLTQKLKEHAGEMNEIKSDLKNIPNFHFVSSQPENPKLNDLWVDTSSNK